MRCGICNRHLEALTSMRRGIGPKCYQKLISQMESGAHGLAVKMDLMRQKMHSKRWRNAKKYMLGPGEVRCENCNRPVIYNPSDGCPGAYCCSPCCPFAAEKPCPREEQKAQADPPKDAPTVELVDQVQNGTAQNSIQATIEQWGP